MSRSGNAFAEFSGFSMAEGRMYRGAVIVAARSAVTKPVWNGFFAPEMASFCAFCDAQSRRERTWWRCVSRCQVMVYRNGRGVHE